MVRGDISTCDPMYDHDIAKESAREASVDKAFDAIEARLDVYLCEQFGKYAPAIKMLIVDHELTAIFDELELDEKERAVLSFDKEKLEELLIEDIQNNYGD